jgi:hypothetical protein
MDWLFSWEVTSVVVPLCIGAAIGVLALNDFKLAKSCFLLAAAEAVGGLVMAVSHSGANGVWRAIIAFFACGVVGVLLLLSWDYVESKRQPALPAAPSQAQNSLTVIPSPTPSPAIPKSLPPKHHDVVSSKPIVPRIPVPKPLNETRGVDNFPMDSALSLSIVDPTSPGIVFENAGDSLVEGLTWELVMFRESDGVFFSYDRVGGGITPAVLPHHRTCRSASGGS